MRIFVAGCFVLAFLVPAAARASSIFVFTTNTSSLSGTGYIDLQYNALSGAGYSVASITSFSTDGTLGGCVPASACLTGDASGNLASTVTIGNGALDNSSYNDYAEAITFGTFVRFLVTLSGPPGGTVDSLFVLTYYNSDYSQYLLSADPNGASATLDIKPDGTVLIQTYPAAGGSYDTTLGSSVPEPVSVFTALAGLVLLAGGRFRIGRLTRLR
jgi:hypothetical protein